MKELLQGLFTLICLLFLTGMVIGPPWGGLCAYLTGTLFVVSMIGRDR